MQPPYPSGGFPPALRFHVTAAVDTWSTRPSLSTSKGMEQWTLNNLADDDSSTLANRTQHDCQMENAFQQNERCDSVPAGHKIATLSKRQTIAWLPPQGRQTPSESLPKLDIDSLMWTDANNFLRSSYSAEYPIAEGTTIMLCNLPYRLTQEQLAQIADDLGFVGMYNLVYIPKSFKGGCGYGFMNFLTLEVAASFGVAFDSFKFSGSSRAKRPFVRWAQTEGLRDTLAIIRGGRNFRRRGHAPLLLNSAVISSVDDIDVGAGGIIL